MQLYQINFCEFEGTKANGIYVLFVSASNFMKLDLASCKFYVLFGTCKECLNIKFVFLSCSYIHTYLHVCSFYISLTYMKTSWSCISYIWQFTQSDLLQFFRVFPEMLWRTADWHWPNYESMFQDKRPICQPNKCTITQYNLKDCAIPNQHFLPKRSLKFSTMILSLKYPYHIF